MIRHYPRGPSRIEFAPAGVPRTPVRSDEEIKQLDAAEAERKLRAKIEAFTAAARIPGRYANASLDDLEDLPEELRDPDTNRLVSVRTPYERVVARLKRLETDPQTIALIGVRGPGKTHMGCALVRHFIAQGKSAVYLHAADYFQELKRTYARDARRDESQVEVDFIRPALVVIDALEERADTRWEDRMITRLIDKRYAEQRATVMIANLDREKFEERIGPTVADRMPKRDGVILCTWPSLRESIEEAS